MRHFSYESTKVDLKLGQIIYENGPNKSDRLIAIWYLNAMIQSPDRAAVRTLARRSESDIVAELRAALATSSASVAAVPRRGLDLLRKAKADGARATLVAPLMKRYRLSTEEGGVLMFLADALRAEKRRAGEG